MKAHVICMNAMEKSMATTGALARSFERESPDFNDFYNRVRQQPVYVILGVQGSGTNLLRSILVSAFSFSVVQDQSLVFDAAARLGSAPSAAALRREFTGLDARAVPSTLGRKALRRIKTNGSFEGLGARFDPALIRSGTDLAYLMYAASAFSLGTTLMAIKSDDLWQSIRHIDQVLPNRRIILLTRDFRDNLLSITRKHFGPIDPLVSAEYVKRRFALYEAEYRRTLAAHRFHVRYEDLLEAPDSFVADFQKHFGLGADRERVPPVDRGRIRQNNRRKWASLRPEQLAQVEAILRTELNTYGYGTERPEAALPGITTRLAARARDMAWRVPQKLRDYAARLRK